MTLFFCYIPNPPIFPNVFMKEGTIKPKARSGSMTATTVAIIVQSMYLRVFSTEI